MTPFWLFLGAFALRIAVGFVLPHPAYPDAFYYANIGQQLAAGNGFSVDYLWNFVEVGGRLPADPQLPVPSNAHWMPLAALIQVPFIWLLGATPLASGLPFWIVAALAAPLTFLIGRDAGLEHRQSVAAGLLAALGGGAAPFLSQPDNFALYLTLGALALWLCARGIRGDRRAFVVGGAVVGLATLSRNDGVLLGVPFALAFLADVRRPRLERRVGWLVAIACAAGFALVAGPWFVRQLQVFGSISPSAAGGRILFIHEYRDLYSITGDTSLPGFLAQGLPSLVMSRLSGLVSAVVIFASTPLLLFLAPFALGGAWRQRRDAAFVPWHVYALTLLAFNALLFAVHVPYGTFLHSAVALMPHAYLLATVGIVAAVHRVARRRPGWDVGKAATRYLAVAVIGVAIGSLGATAVISRTWTARETLRREIGSAMTTVPSTDRVMSPDAGAYRYLTGRGGIVTPDDPLPVIRDAAAAYQVRWLILERGHLVEALAPVFAGRERPAWLSAEPVHVARAADGALSVAVFAVCLDAPAAAAPTGATAAPDARCARR